jgi:acyl-CoA thioesterase-1
VEKDDGQDRERAQPVDVGAVAQPWGRSLLLPVSRCSLRDAVDLDRFGRGENGGVVGPRLVPERSAWWDAVVSRIDAPSRARRGLLVTLVAFPLACRSRAESRPRTRIACLGDSITFGSTLADPKTQSYPARLAELLGGAYEVRGFGVRGATLLRGGDKPFRDQPELGAARDFAPDVVVVLLGTNDSKPHNIGPRPAEFVRDYVELARDISRWPSHPKLLAASPPPAFPGRWAITDVALARDIAPKVEEAARLSGIGFVDLRAALAGRDELFPDKVHPDEAGALRIAEVVRDALPRAAAARP